MKKGKSDPGKDCAGGSSSIHWEHSPEDEEDVVAVLRRVQAQYPLRAVLAAAGAVLVSAGGAWAVSRFLRAHPYLLVIGLGLVCLIAASATCSEGLAIYLPASVQHHLLKVTLFDLLHDDAAFLNFTRKWMRMLMICYAGSEGEIENLTRGLDPEFVDMVFNRTMIDWLPIGVRRLLLPEKAPENGDHPDTCDEEETHSNARKHWKVAVSAVKAMVRVKQLQQKGKVDVDAESVTHKAVWETLCSRRDEVSRKYVEPELGPAITKAIIQQLWNAPVLRFIPSARFFQMTSFAAATFWWGTSGMILYLPAAQRWALRGLSMVGFSSSNRNLHLLRASRFANFLGILSIGMSIACLAYRRRLSDLRDTLNGDASRINGAGFHMAAEPE